MSSFDRRVVASNLLQPHTILPFKLRAEATWISHVQAGQQAGQGTPLGTSVRVEKPGLLIVRRVLAGSSSSQVTYLVQIL